MSFGFLPVPVFIAMVFLCSVIMFAYSVKYYKAEKVVGMGFGLFGVSALIEIAIKIIEEYFKNYEHYVGILLILAGVIFFTGFTFLLIGRWKYAMKDPQRKKHLIASLIIIVVGISLMVIASTIY